MLEATKEFFKTVGLKINAAKSTTNLEACADSGEVLERTQGYKYLSIIKDSGSKLLGETYKRIQK